MLKAFVESIANLVTGGVRPQILDQLSDRRTAVVAMPDGALAPMAIAPPDRVCRLQTVAELAAFAAAHCEETPGVIFYNESGLTFVEPTVGGEDTAVCPLTPSDAWELLKKLDDPVGGSLPQREFLRLGRFVLRMSPEKLEPFRRIDFSQNTSGVSEMRKDRENLGKNINAQVMTGGAPIPDFVDVTVPIFDTPGEDAPFMIRLDLEIAMADQRIILKPCPDELRRCMQTHLADLRERIESGLGDASEHCDVYHGSPWQKRV